MKQITDDKYKLNDIGLRKAIARREGRHPKMPSDLNQLVLEKVESRSKRPHRQWMLRIAACALLLIALAAMWKFSQKKPSDKPLTASVDKSKPTSLQHSVKPENESKETQDITHKKISSKKLVSTASHQIDRQESISAEETQEDEDVAPTASPNDTLLNSETSRLMANYIAQLAKMAHTQELPLDCSNLGKSAIYVFPDDKETDIYTRLNMIATWCDFNDSTLRMRSTAQQMVIEIARSQNVEGVKELWMAKRRYGNIYLYHTRSIGNEIPMMACYQDFLNKNARKRNNCG